MFIIFRNRQTKNKEILIYENNQVRFIYSDFIFYYIRVNFRLKPKLVLEVGKVLATNGLFIV